MGLNKLPPELVSIGSGSAELQVTVQEPAGDERRPVPEATESVAVTFGISEEGIIPPEAFRNRNASTIGVPLLTGPTGMPSRTLVSGLGDASNTLPETAKLSKAVLFPMKRGLTGARECARPIMTRALATVFWS